MPNSLQLVLVSVSLIVFLFVLRKIRKSQLQIQNSIIWIIGSLFLLVISVFDKLMEYFAQKLGFMSTSNFVLVCVCFFLLVIVFHQDIKISILDEKLKNLNHHAALEEMDEGKKANEE